MNDPTGERIPQAPVRRADARNAKLRSPPSVADMGFSIAVRTLLMVVSMENRDTSTFSSPGWTTKLDLFFILLIERDRIHVNKQN
jgi:hypothetical protein